MARTNLLCVSYADSLSAQHFHVKPSRFMFSIEQSRNIKYHVDLHGQLKKITIFQFHIYWLSKIIC